MSAEIQFEATVQMNGQGRITVPKSVREELGLEFGALVTFVMSGGAVKLVPSKIVERDSSPSHLRRVLLGTQRLGSEIINDRTATTIQFTNAGGRVERFFLLPENDGDGVTTLYLFEDTQYWREVLDRGGDNFTGDYGSMYTIALNDVNELIPTQWSDGSAQPESQQFYTQRGEPIINVIADILNADDPVKVGTLLDSSR